MSRRKKNRLVGSYREPAAPPINLPLTIDNLAMLLAEGARQDSPYTHEQIKDWADRFWWEWDGRERLIEVELPPRIREIAHLAQDIEAQWDMFLANTHTPRELQSLDFAQVQLPHAWFAQWLASLRQLMEPSDGAST